MGATVTVESVKYQCRGLYMVEVFVAVLLIGAVVTIVQEVMQGYERKGDAQRFDVDFLASCRVAREIAYIEYRAGQIVLARCVDGRWGIASQNGWLHLGQGKYIASKWKQYTGQWPYIHF